jgi:catechol 2,3-dioxygenase-like lactoylglutathione lyase family enzyme
VSDWHIRSIFHFVWPCTNVERSIAFFRHFGFEIIKDNRNVVWPDFVGTNFAMKPGAQGKAVQLILPQDDALQTRLDLIEWIDPRWTPEHSSKPLEQRIARVMALLTHNIEAAAAALIGKGLKPTQPLRPADDVIGVQGVVCFPDPDGNIVELIEYFPGQLGSRTDRLEHRT